MIWHKISEKKPKKNKWCIVAHEISDINKYRIFGDLSYTDGIVPLQYITHEGIDHWMSKRYAVYRMNDTDLWTYVELPKGVDYIDMYTNTIYV